VKTDTPFPKAPIVEVVLDIQVEPAEGMNTEQIGMFFDPVKGRYPEKERNLAKTIELIDLCFKLKEAYLKRQHPEASPEKIRDLINRGILARKEQQWASPEICSTP
jgi:uncharacterized protein (TIGR04255 family)